MGRIAREIQTVLGVTYQTSYQYDKAGNIAAVTYPDGLQVAYAYNALNLPSGVTRSDGSGVETLASRISYDGNGNMLNMVFGNRLDGKWSYDARNRISRIAVPDILDILYSRDMKGNVTAVKDKLRAGGFEVIHLRSHGSARNGCGAVGRAALCL